MTKSDDDIKISNFKSPLPKLLNVFKKSRDNWKAKYMGVKYQVKLLSNQIQYWKKQNIKLKRQIEKLKKELSSSNEKKT